MKKTLILVLVLVSIFSIAATSFAAEPIVMGKADWLLTEQDALRWLL